MPKNIDDELHFKICENKEDWAIVNGLREFSKEEDGFYDDDIYDKWGKEAMLMINEMKYPIGYILWTRKKTMESEENVFLREFYVLKRFRRKGYGTRLLKFWVENYADKINDKFIVVSCNLDTFRILYFLGYVYDPDESIKKAMENNDTYHDFYMGNFRQCVGKVMLY